MSTNCATGSLSPFVPTPSNPWDEKKVRHLFRRLGFGAGYQEIQDALTKSPSQVVSELIAEARNAPLPAAPPWYNWDINDYVDFPMEANQQIIEWYNQWMNDMIITHVREKMALFWHNHFVTQVDVYVCPSYMYEYHKLLQEYAFGNFRDFLKAIAKTPAMLVFLDGVTNKKGTPNENYARELFELFTLGANNGYTQQDIEEAARALTGWTAMSNRCGSIGFNPADFDNSPKTIFGVTSNFDFDGVHDLIFQERPVEVATFIATKLYQHFVHPVVDDTIVNGMAQTFISNNFEIAPVMLELMTSEHFYDEEILGTQIKSPVEFLIGIIREGDFPYDNQIIGAVGFLTHQMGQTLFNPIDVSGWNGNRAWIDSTAITTRWDALSQYMDYVYAILDKERFRQLAIEVSGNSSDVQLVARSIVDHFIPKGLDGNQAYNQATTALKWQIPQTYFDLNLWDLNYQYVPEQVWNLMKWIIRRPEFQLT